MMNVDKERLASIIENEIIGVAIFCSTMSVLR